MKLCLIKVAKSDACIRPFSQIQSHIVSTENQLFTTFKKHYPQLLLLTDYDHLSPYCVSEGIISTDDDERINKAITKKDKARIVLMIVSRHLEANCDSSFLSLLGIMETHGNLCTKQMAELIKSEILN